MKFFKLSMVIMMLVMITVINTDSYSQSNTSLGIESGLNLANMSLTPNFTTSSRTGLMVGGFADIGVSRIVSIRPGIRYVTKGFSTTSNGVTFNEKLSYLELPMLLKASIPLDRIKPYFTAGPTLGIQLSASEEITNGVQVQTNDAGTAWETIDMGLYFGGGIEFHVAHNTDVFTGFGYTLGLTNVSKIQGIEGKNNGIHITGGIKFGL
ncbi:MAG TPA: porin family protein [Ignavibacteria bacterium]|nr:porin family protein [Ignavibacteria bacterium]